MQNKQHTPAPWICEDISFFTGDIKTATADGFINHNTNYSF